MVIVPPLTDRPIANMKIGKNGEMIGGIVLFTMHEMEQGLY
jgi:hypothetical protein